MKLEELMQELSARLGLGELDLDDDGGAEIIVGDELTVDIGRDEAHTGFCLSATVGRMPAEGREAVFGELLAANLLGRGTGGAALSVDSSLDEIVLCRNITHDELPFEVFEQELATFVEVLKLWHDRYQRDLIGTPETEAELTDDSSDQSTGSMMRV